MKYSKNSKSNSSHKRFQAENQRNYNSNNSCQNNDELHSASFLSKISFLKKNSFVFFFIKK